MRSEIAILMSTYNGEKYLKEQIESIIKQSNQDWHLYIRDDNSKDSSRTIIREYAEKNEKITFINADSTDNVGVCRSFIALVQYAEAQYYMFCDQDDVWKTDKVDQTLNRMQQAKSLLRPVLVYTDLEIVDENLTPLGRMYGDRVWFSFIQFLFTNCATGCTVMFNQALKQKINFSTLNYDDIYMHDWWFAMVAAQFGEVLYVNEPTINYRQHAGNVVGSGEENTFRRLVARFVLHQSDVIHAQQIVRAAHEFNRLYGDEVSGMDKQYLSAYGDLYTKSSFLHNLNLVVKYPAQRINPKGKLFYSYLFVMFAKNFKFSDR